MPLPPTFCAPGSPHRRERASPRPRARRDAARRSPRGSQPCVVPPLPGPRRRADHRRVVDGDEASGTQQLQAALVVGEVVGLVGIDEREVVAARLRPLRGVRRASRSRARDAGRSCLPRRPSSSACARSWSTPRLHRRRRSCHRAGSASATTSELYPVNTPTSMQLRAPMSFTSSCMNCPWSGPICMPPCLMPAVTSRSAASAGWSRTEWSTI